MAEEYTLTDYRIDLHRLRRVELNPAIAGLASGVYDGLSFEDWPATLACLERLLDAMTPEERRAPKRIGSVEMQRLAAATGTGAEEVERAVRHFQRVPDAIRRLNGLSMWERIKVLCGTSNTFPRPA